VRLETTAGITGYGEGGPAKAAEITEARPVVIGRVATDIEYIRHHLAASPALEAAVNNAFLDITARSAKVPVYQYLGGPTRYKARAMATLEGEDETALIESLRRARDNGFKAFSFPFPARDSMTRMQAYVDTVRQRIDRMRSAAGPGTDFVVDGAASFTPGDAAYIATALERQHMLWFDEPTAVLNSDALAKIADESVMPVGLGRHVHEVSTFQNLLRFGCVDVLRPSVGMNSIPKIRRMAAVAETHYVAVAPYHNGGPIGTVAAIHLAASLPNFFIQQMPHPSAERDRAMRAEIVSGQHEIAKDGFSALINHPGLGITVNEKALDQYSEETI
jgi:galactonate dehydratase